MSPRALALAGALALAMAAGWGARSLVDAPSPPPTEPCRAATPEQVRAIVAGLAAERPAAVVAPSAPSAPAPEPPEAAAADTHPDSDRALWSIEAAIADGEWTEEDRDLLRRTHAKLSLEARQRVQTTLAAAINGQRLRLTYDGMPF